MEILVVQVRRTSDLRDTASSPSAYDGNAGIAWEVVAEARRVVDLSETPKQISNADEGVAEAY